MNGNRKDRGNTHSRFRLAVRTANRETNASFDLLKIQLLKHRWWIISFLVVATVWQGLRTPSRPELSQEVLELCRADLVCWVGLHAAKAEAGCRHLVESAAKNNAVWDIDGFGKVLTSWYDQQKGSLQLLGESVRFKDDQGALKRMAFSCIYDTVSSKARLQQLGLAK